MMKLFVGLGNPGNTYERNRHNIGFRVIDRLIGDLNATSVSKSQFQGQLAKAGDILLLKPTTFMNLSGQSVHAVAAYYHVDLSDIVVIHDDLDLPFGALRFKQGGGSGGHNGLRSIDQHCKSDYKRVRLGIGKPVTKQDVASYVLANFSTDEEAKLAALIDDAAAACRALASSSLAEVSSRYTRKGEG